MTLKIRLINKLNKNNKFYRIAVIKSVNANKGQTLDIIGTYLPFIKKGEKKYVFMNVKKVQYWLTRGALPSKRLLKILMDSGLIKSI